MTFPDTRPYCGQCGWNPDNSGLGDLNADLVCDSCGADLTLYGFKHPVPATGATAGTPGTWTPEPAIPPADFSAIGGIVASPPTLWEEGQYVVLGDGSHAYWDGTAWIAGVAPSGPPSPPSPTAFFSFADIDSYLTTPNTADLADAAVYELYIDAQAPDWSAIPSNSNMFVNGSILTNYRALMITSSKPATGLKDGGGTPKTFPGTLLLSGGGRHAIKGSYDSGTDIPVVSIDETSEVGSVLNAQIPLSTVSEDMVINGRAGAAGTFGFIGDVFLAQMTSGGVLVARMDADDGGFPAGAVADGLTFTSNGRVWTVHGTGVSYTPPV